MIRTIAAALLAATTFLGGSAFAAEPPKKPADLPYCDPPAAGTGATAATPVSRTGVPAAVAPAQATAPAVYEDEEGNQVVDNRSVEERLRQLELQNKELQQKVVEMQRDQKDANAKIKASRRCGVASVVSSTSVPSMSPATAAVSARTPATRASRNTATSKIRGCSSAIHCRR